MINDVRQNAYLPKQTRICRNKPFFSLLSVLDKSAHSASIFVSLTVDLVLLVVFGSRQSVPGS